MGQTLVKELEHGLQWQTDGVGLPIKLNQGKSGFAVLPYDRNSFNERVSVKLARQLCTVLARWCEEQSGKGSESCG